MRFSHRKGGGCKSVCHVSLSVFIKMSNGDILLLVPSLSALINFVGKRTLHSVVATKLVVVLFEQQRQTPMMWGDFYWL